MVLTKAWKLINTTEMERHEIERDLKISMRLCKYRFLNIVEVRYNLFLIIIVAALCYTEDSLITTNANDFHQLKILFEKLGDGSCSLKNYDKAIKSYLKMLEYAEKCGESGKELVPIYVR